MERAKLGDQREGEGWGLSLLTSFRCSCLEIDKEMAAWLLVSKGMQMSQELISAVFLENLGRFIPLFVKQVYHSVRLPKNIYIMGNVALDHSSSDQPCLVLITE